MPPGDVTVRPMSGGAIFRGTYELELRRGGELVTAWREHNTLTWQGVSHLLLRGLLERGWLIGMKVGGEGSENDTATSHEWVPSPFNENGVRPFWRPDLTERGVVSNRAEPAVIVFEQDTPVDGIYIESADGSVLLSVAEWYATQDIYAGDEITVTYTIEGVL